MLDVLKTAAREFRQDDCGRMAAAMSYYAVFSLPALLLLVLVLASWFIDPLRAEARVGADLARWLGPRAAQQVLDAIRNITPGGEGAAPWTVWVTAFAVLFGASGAFGQLQSTLNRIWEVAPAPGGGVRKFLLKRLLSLTMVAGLAVVVLASVLLSAGVAAFGSRWSALTGGHLEAAGLAAANTSLTWLLVALFFAAVYRVLPDAEVAWRDVWVGAAGTALLFVAGQAVIGLVLARLQPVRAFGTAGSLAVVLAWVYYSSMILFFGAEFTQAWSRSRGRRIVPSPGAVRIVLGTIPRDAA